MIKNLRNDDHQNREHMIKVVAEAWSSTSNTLSTSEWITFIVSHPSKGSTYLKIMKAWSRWFANNTLSRVYDAEFVPCWYSMDKYGMLSTFSFRDFKHRKHDQAIMCENRIPLSVGLILRWKWGWEPSSPSPTAFFRNNATFLHASVSGVYLIIVPIFSAHWSR